MKSKNEADVDLLYNSPNALVEKYQSTISIIVQKFVSSGFFRTDEKEDVIQFINLRLLESRIRNMQAQYNHTCFVSTYFSKIVYNLCLEHKRGRKRAEGAAESLEERHYDGMSEKEEVVYSELVIQAEFKRLETILKLFGKTRHKVELILKLVARIIVLRRDVLAFCPGCTSEKLKRFLQLFGVNFDHLRDKEVYAGATPLVNACDQKKNSPDALRKWVKSKVQEILDLLNGRLKTSNYDESAFKILLQKYYETGISSEALHES